MSEQVFALINGGIVENLIVADQAFADVIAPQYEAVVDATGTVAYIGGEYANGAFVPRPVEPVPDGSQ